MNLSRLSIRHHLLLIVAIIALPAICIIINAGVQQREDDIRDAKLVTQKLAEVIVAEQKNLVASTRQLFIALSQLPEIKNHNAAQAQAILAEILKLSPQYSNLFIADSSGAVWASAVPLTGPVSIADRRYFINALASGRLSSGEYHIARTSNQPTLNLGYPLQNHAGQIGDIIVAGFSLDRYRRVFDTHDLPAGASFALLDYKGIILTRAIDPEKYLGKPSNPEIFRHMQEGPDEETAIGTSSVVGDHRVQTYRKIRLDGETTPYMYVRVGIPTGTVLAAANAELVENLAIYSVFLMIAISLSWLTGRKYIIDKVFALQRSSHRLAEGHLDTRVAHEVGGGELGQLGKAFDTMAAKLALREQALRESEKNYRDIFNTSHDALFVNDDAGRIIEVNKSSEQMFGYSRAELLGLTVEDLIAGEPPHSLAEALLLIEKAFNEGTQEFEWVSKRKNGELFWTEIAVIPTGDAGKRQVLAVIRDITERKEIEHMKEALLSNISHEMRTPLTSMLGFLEFVLENELDDAQTRDYHATMYKEAVRLNEMITNFLDMQRLKSNLHQYVFTHIDVRQLLAEVVAIFASPCARHTIILDTPSDLPPVSGDDELLHQALSNLLSNAIKYSPEGSEIRLGAKAEGTTVIFSVNDRGIGIPPESLHRIFDLFYRVEGTAKRQIAGTGLGLALVKGIVDAHKGRVWAESSPGQGSTFYLALPAAGNPH
jgi:PAS domain S-box-containing protein